MLAERITGSTDLTLKRAADSDFDLAFAIKKEAGGNYIREVFGWDEQVQIGFHEKQFVPENASLILWKGNVVGWVSIFDHEEWATLGESYVLPGFQGRGIGTSVLLEAIAHAELRGVPLRLRVFKINTAGIRLYERLGFRKRDEDKTCLYMATTVSKE